MSMQNQNEEKVVYCKYCAKVCIKLASTTKENPGMSDAEAFEVMLKDKNDAIAQLELENDRFWEDLVKEREHTNCLNKYLKVTIILLVCCVIKALYW
ncbi:hypothetical protein LIER_40068 [Lithospermum erythrorhizon]|uniref:Transmembrane protein n=1 Tax=Lithospermum erythrorhizon TaxID=34254 RepID=A0AAV3QRI7_LITER